MSNSNEALYAIITDVGMSVVKLIINLFFAFIIQINITISINSPLKLHFGRVE